MPVKGILSNCLSGKEYGKLQLCLTYQGSMLEKYKAVGPAGLTRGALAHPRAGRSY